MLYCYIYSLFICTGYSKLAFDQLFVRETRDYIKKRFHDRKLVGVWDVFRRDQLFMHSDNQDSLKECIEILTTNLCEEVMQIKENNSCLISPEGDTFIAHLEEKHAGFLKFQKTPQELRFVVPTDRKDDILQAISAFVDMNVKLTEFVDAGSHGKYCFIYNFRKRELDSIEKSYSSLHVAITPVDEKMRFGFQITGVKKNCKKIVERVRELIDSVLERDMVVTKANFAEFVNSPQGKRAIKRIEKQSLCVIRVTSTAKPNYQTGYRAITSMTVGKTEVVLAKGDLLTMTADALVIPAPTTLAYKFGFGADVVKKGTVIITLPTHIYAIYCTRFYFD